MSTIKSNESDLTIERESQDELPELAVRILSDFARIVAAEARLLESNVVGAATTLLGQVYLTSTLIVLAAGGIVALLASLVLLLHRWMPYWQVLGLVGVGAIVAAEVLRRSLTAATTVNIA
ncbi:MAG: hypothetical protein WCD12_03225 [Candidatus Binatus sp.]|jgi:hypothetical protein|uniref:hypothetical protein n=1 Tax=Candidatus Binatus sp. TaxID=2811406 RepID=UPI003C719DE2